jgi:polar amino acid transport system substrate-binding protein
MARRIPDASCPHWRANGFLVRAGNPKSLDSHTSVAACGEARLGIIAGQVQHESARASGVRDEQINVFEQQFDAVDALRCGAIDAYASTAVGNRILSTRLGHAELEAVAHKTAGAQHAPVGAFSFNKSNSRLLSAVNEQLRLYLGSANHRTRMARYGLTDEELDPALVGKPECC